MWSRDISSVLEIFRRARLSFLFEVYLVKTVLFSFLCLSLSLWVKVVPLNETEQKPTSFRPTSCVDYLRRGISESGRYKLYDQSGKSYAAYCDMKSELDTAWTMVMSWTLVNRRLSAFLKIPFKYNSPQNEDNLNWDLYRLSLARMRFLQGQSTHWRATCSYPINGIDFRDYLRGNFKDFNIIDYVGGGTCKKVEYINIRGHVATDLTVPFWQKLNTWTLHTDSTYTHCQFKVAKSGAVREEDNFGWYASGMSTKFRCTQGTQSTTQWWFGGHI